MAETAPLNSGMLQVRHEACSLSLSYNGPSIETLTDMLRGSRFLPSSLTNTYGLVRDEAGAKEHIDDDLKRACEAVIEQCSTTLTHPLQTFLETLVASRSINIPNQKGPSQDALLVESAFTTEEEFSRILEKEASQMASHLRLYLDDGGTVSVLLSHIQDKIVDEYTVFRKTVERLPMPESKAYKTSPENIRTLLSTV